MSNNFHIIIADWNQHKSTLESLRKTVFVDEQSVPEELEWDGHDDDCTHFLVSIDGQFIATARLKPDGQIGRMAVLKEHRRAGVGSALLDFIIEHAEHIGFKKIFLHSQVSAIEFYLRKGFEKTGDEFLDANIPHQAMFRSIHPLSSTS